MVCRGKTVESHRLKVLRDHNIPVQLLPLLGGYEAFTARQMRWDTLGNGALLAAAEDAGFAATITGDKNIHYQQNSAKRRIALVVVSRTDRPVVVASVELIKEALDRVDVGSFERVLLPGLKS